MSEVRELRGYYPKNKAVICLLLGTTITLYFGLSMPLLYLEKLYFWSNDYSVVTGIIGLFEDAEYLLAAVILFFSLVFPVTKIGLLAVVWWWPMTHGQRIGVLRWLGFLGKWSMLDVFIVAILVVAAKLGSLASVEPRPGVYVFGCAILLSMLTTFHVERLAKRAARG